MASSEPRHQINARLPQKLVKRAAACARRVGRTKVTRISITTLVRIGLERVCAEIERTGTIDLHVGEK